MNVNELFPSKFVAASDLMGQDVPVVIAAVRQEKVGADEEQRPVLYFQGFVKGMVMNRTNAKRISTLYGTETDKWVGKPITLYPSETEFGGDTVPCIRVRQEAPLLSSLPTPPAPAPAQQPVMAGNGSPRF